MTNDFQLFPDPDSEGRIDPDVALMSAYLARELSHLQMLAVEERLTTDRAFRTAMQPLIDAWAAPVPGDTAARAVDAPLSSREQDESWRRFQREESEKTKGVFSSRRWAPIARVAAIIAMVVLPVVSFGQFVMYAADHPGVVGHEAALRIVAAFGREPRPVVSNLRAIEITPLDLHAATQVNDVAAPRPLRLAQAVQQSIPIVELAAGARSTVTFGGVLGAKVVPTGLLVNDAASRQLVLLSPDLASATVTLDSVPGTSRSYGLQPGLPLLSFTGDSSLLFDMETRAARVIDGRGQVARMLAPMTERPYFTRLPSGVDPNGRLLAQAIRNFSKDVYVPLSGLLPSAVEPQQGVRRMVGRGGGGGENSNTRRVTTGDRPDSLAIVRLDFEHRRHDTLAFVNQPPNEVGPRYPYGGGKTIITFGKDSVPISARQVINPLYPVDQWASLPDGTIGIARGSDYHVDWIHPDGSRSASPKLPFDWKRLTDADKQRLIDSARTYIDSGDAFVARRFVNGPRSAETDSMRARGGRAAPRLAPYTIVPPSQIADYYPPITEGLNSVLADRDGNLWILPRHTSLSKRGELVYDVVNKKDGLVRRVRLPLGRSVVAFGPGGVVYLQSGDLQKGFVLERATVTTPK